MNKEALKKKIAEILGVSESEKDLAFEMMLKKLSEILNYDEAINIPDIGLFSLKKEPLLREERSEKAGRSSKRNLIFLPDESDTAESSKSMYLTFNLDNTNQDYLEFDENVFSISVDKPVVSVNGIKSGNAANENSEKMLATLEEKVQKLVSNTEKIPDYDIWNEFASKENVSEKEAEDQTDTSQDEDLKQLVSEKVGIDIVKENESEESEIESQNENVVDEINDINLDAELENKNIEETETEVDFELSANDEETVEETLEESNVEKAESDENNSAEDDKNTDDSEEINWDWGDELKEELEADVSPTTEEDPTTEKADENKSSELFDPVDDEKVEEESIEAETDEIESDESERDDTEEDAEENETENVGDSTQTVMYSPEDFEAEKGKKAETETGKKKFEITKTLWMLIGVFVLIGIIGIYFLFFTGDETPEVNKNVVPDTLIHKKLKPIENNTKLNIKEKASESTGENVVQKEEQNKSETKEKKNTNVKPASDNQSGSLYRTFPDEKQIRNLIFYQNGVYSVQVSSRRSKTKAEQYVKKLRNVGYNAFIVKTYLSKLKSTWYRVRIGFFKTEKEAMDFRMKNKF